MNSIRKIRYINLIYIAFIVIGSSFWSGCRDDGASTQLDDVVNAERGQDEEALSDLKALLSDSPDPKSLPDELKADQTFPKTFDLVDLQSPVKSQGSRGVCSIFSTVALMEHLYIKKGAEIPDFSENFLQWSVKSELGRFKDTYGSNGSANISAINRFGIVEERVQPYESYKWTDTHDERCSKDSEEKPIQCFTNGDPSEEVLEAKRWTLPPSRWISSTVQNLKAFMHENDTGVVVGMTFFYQSWNHRKSALPVSAEYKRKGYILYPNEEDKEESLKKSAGHSILIIGWDDDLEVPVLDAKGEQVLDEEGEPIVERGFFLFKNSWGKSAFGTENPFGPGYGWLSMRYVKEYGRTVSTRPPQEDLTEKCDDGFDNNFDGALDCDDLSCGDSAACQPPAEPTSVDFEISSDEEDLIPDLGELSQTLTIEEEGALSALTVEVEIDHVFAGDLEVTLTSPQGTLVILQSSNHEDTSKDLHLTLHPEAFLGESAQGTWTLVARDVLERDEGHLISWRLSGVLTSSLIDEPVSFERTPALSIPDNDAQGVTDVLTIDREAVINSLSLKAQIDHSYRGDLIVSLIHPDGEEVTLFNRDGRNAENLLLEVSVPDFIGRPIGGEWGLRVVDLGRGDEGALKGWTLNALITPTEP